MRQQERGRGPSSGSYITARKGPDHAMISSKNVWFLIIAFDTIN